MLMNLHLSLPRMISPSAHNVQQGILPQTLPILTFSLSIVFQDYSEWGCSSAAVHFGFQQTQPSLPLCEPAFLLSLLASHM